MSGIMGKTYKTVHYFSLDQYIQGVPKWVASCGIVLTGSNIFTNTKEYVTCKRCLKKMMVAQDLEK